MIVLDTHTWIWYIDSPDLLGKKAKNKIEQARSSNDIYVSSISSWEIYMLEKKNRIAFEIGCDIWIRRCEQLSFLNFVPFDNDIAKLSVNLPEPLHQDPADRIIIATAKYLGAKLVTKDEKISNYSHIKTIW